MADDAHAPRNFVIYGEIVTCRGLGVVEFPNELDTILVSGSTLSHITMFFMYWPLHEGHEHLMLIGFSF